MKRIMLVTLFLVIPSFVAFYGWNAGGGGGGRGRETSDYWLARYRDPSMFGEDYVNVYPGAEDTEDAAQRLRMNAGNILQNQMRQQLNQMAIRLINEYAQSPRRVGTEAVNIHIMDEVANESQFMIGDQELRTALRNQVRDYRQSNEALQSMSDREVARVTGLNNPAVQQDLKRRNRRNHVQDMMIARGMASLERVWEDYRSNMETLDVEMVAFRVDDFKEGLTPTTDSVRAHFEASPGVYDLPDQRVYEYIKIDRPTLDEITVTTEAMKAYYDTHPENFIAPRSIQPRLIQISAPSPQAASTTETAQYERKIAAVQEALNATTPTMTFAQLADLYSDDPTNVDFINPDTKLGGLYPDFIDPNGFSSYGRAFNTALGTLKEGETTGPIQSAQATFFIKAETIRPAGPKSFEDAFTDVERMAKREEIDTQFKALGEKLRTESKNQTNFESLAKAMGAVVQTTEKVEKTSVQFEFGSLYGEDQTLANCSSLDPQTPVMSQPNFHIVMRLKEEDPARPPKDLDEVFDAVYDDVLTSMAIAKARASAESFLAMAQKEKAAVADIAPSSDTETTTGVIDSYFTKLAKTDYEDTYTTASFVRDRPTGALRGVEYFAEKTRDATTGTLQMNVATLPAMEEEAAPEPESFVVWRVDDLKGAPTRDTFMEEAPLFLFSNARENGSAMYKEWLADERRARGFELNL